MSLALRCWILVLAMVPAHFSLAASAEHPSDLDPRARKLLADFDAIKREPPNTTVWKPDKGPWAPFLEDSMTGALSSRERKLYETAMLVGDCQSVVSLQSTGFLLAHPFLQAAHAKPLVGEMFVETVVKKSPDYRYCFWGKLLADTLEQIAKLNVANVLPVRLESQTRPDLGDLDYDPQAQNLVHWLCTALLLLTELAIQDDDHRAIATLVNLNKKKDIARLPPSTELYLIERASTLGIEIYAGKQRRDLVYHKLAALLRSRIERHARHRDGPPAISLPWKCPAPPHDARVLDLAPFQLQK